MFYYANVIHSYRDIFLMDYVIFLIHIYLILSILRHPSFAGRTVLNVEQSVFLGQ